MQGKKIYKFIEKLGDGKYHLDLGRRKGHTYSIFLFCKNNPDKKVLVLAPSHEAEKHFNMLLKHKNIILENVVVTNVFAYKQCGGQFDAIFVDGYTKLKEPYEKTINQLFCNKIIFLQ